MSLLRVFMLFELHSLCQRPLTSLIEEAKDLGINRPNLLSRDQLLLDFLFHSASTSSDTGQKTKVVVSGYLEILQGGFGFLRSAHFGFQPSAIDIYVSPTQILRFALSSGDWIEGLARLPRASENNLALLQISSVNSERPNRSERRIPFENHIISKSNSSYFSRTCFSSVEDVHQVRSLVQRSQDRGFTSILYTPFITDLDLQINLAQFSVDLNNGQYFFSRILDAQSSLHETHRLLVNRLKVLASTGKNVHCILLGLENLGFGCSLYAGREPSCIQMLTEISALSRSMTNTGSISTTLFHHSEVDSNLQGVLQSLVRLGLIFNTTYESLDAGLAIP